MGFTTFCLSIIVVLFSAKIAGYTFIWTTYETETWTYQKTVNATIWFGIALHTARFDLNLITFRETYSNHFYIIFFVYRSGFDTCKDRGFHFYMDDIWDWNVNIRIDSTCKNFALKSRCTLLDSIDYLITFRETYINEFYTILFAYYSRFLFWKDRGLHFYMKDIRDRNVNIPIDSKCKNLVWNRPAHCAIQFKCSNFPGKI